jgi:uncharacterized protein YqjF (DUF2071 family)
MKTATIQFSMPEVSDFAKLSIYTVNLYRQYVRAKNRYAFYLTTMDHEGTTKTANDLDAATKELLAAIGLDISTPYLYEDTHRNPDLRSKLIHRVEIMCQVAAR